MVFIGGLFIGGECYGNPHPDGSCGWCADGLASALCLRDNSNDDEGADDAVADDASNDDAGGGSDSSVPLGTVGGIDLFGNTGES